MKARLLITGILSLGIICAANAEQKFNFTPYKEQKVIFDFYFDEPAKIGPALFWLRSWINTLMNPPYREAPEFLEAIVMIHGTELVTLARKNEKKYKPVVDRIRYYVSLGVKFKVCAQAVRDFDYKEDDFYDFVEIIPSSMTELVHWQQQGYGLITPRIYSRKYTIDEIR